MSEGTDPFQDVEQFFEELRQFGAASGDVAVDVKDEGDAFVVIADLPGYDTDDITVQLAAEDKLSIAAEHAESETDEDGEYVRRERHAERVERTVSLPAPVDAEATAASHENGVLTVRLEKETGSQEGTDIPVN